MGFDPRWLNEFEAKGLRPTAGTPAAREPVPTPVRSEEEFQKAVIDLAHAWGWLVAHFRRVRVQRADGSAYWETPVQADGKGHPDLILVRERVIAAELKVGKNRPTPEQRAWLAAYRGAGLAAYLWRPADWAEVVGVLARPAPGTPPASPSGPEGT